MRRIGLGLCTVVAAVALGGGTAEAKTNCGSFTKNGGRVTVYKIRGHVSCRTARRVSRHAIGATCQGEKIAGGWKCTHGAKALGEPESSGFTLRKGRKNVQGRVR